MSACAISRRNLPAVLNLPPLGLMLLIAATCGPSHACTIGVAAGRATADGRPLLWKVRDQGAYPDNHVIWNGSSANPYGFVAVANAGDTLAWMGVNEAGFAIVNSNSLDLVGRADFANGSLMHHALGHCATVADFLRLLDGTGAGGMRDVHANYGVIDATGEAWMFEVEDSLFWGYDADAGLENPAGFIVRTNFSVAGGGANGMARYLRSVALISALCAGDSLTYRSLLRYHARDFSDDASLPIPIPYPGQWNPNVPYGYIWTYLSICRAGSVSGVVVRGVQPGRTPWQTTMWTLLGQPAAAIAAPVWPVGPVPASLSGAFTAPLCDAANLIRDLLLDCSYEDYLDSYKLRSESGHGLWRLTFAVEDSLFQAVDGLDLAWVSRHSTVPDPADVASQLADQALAGLTRAYDALVTAEPMDGLTARHTPNGIILAWEPATHSVAGTSLPVLGYEVRCAMAPGTDSDLFLNVTATESWCLVSSVPEAGFFCRVTALTRFRSSPGSWVWVRPLMQ